MSFPFPKAISPIYSRQKPAEIRMQQAMHLLNETDTPLSELYSHLGYSNANSFRRAFKKVYGSSPKAFRRTGDDTE